MERRLVDLIHLPTIAQAKDFKEMANRTGWAASQEETFERAFQYLEDWLGRFADQIASQTIVRKAFVGKNLWGLVKGRDHTRAILLQGHYDVVDFDGDFEPKLDGRRLYGRGTTDMKGALVTALTALETIVQRGERPALDTYILLTCEEEIEAFASIEFANNAPDWTYKVVFAICMESGYHDDHLQFAVRHPGIARVDLKMPLARASAGGFHRVRIDPGESYVRHASLEPETLDPNALMLSVLSKLGAPIIADLQSKSPESASNATASFCECVVSASLTDVALKQVCLEQLQEHLALVKKPEVAANLRQNPPITVEPAEGEGGYDGSRFVDVLQAFRREVQGNYSNALYGRPPFTIAALQVQNGIARANMDIRTDVALRDDLDRLCMQIFDANTAEVRWNDPGLENPAIESSPDLLRLRAVSEEHIRVEITSHSGWTEAAVWWTQLGIPTVIVGPGHFGLAHTRDEYIDLENMKQMRAILEEYLLTAGEALG
jgi:acetylornithine deacetylase/succinyl-diaminopimelate desuccinylase-like protein